MTNPSNYRSAQHLDQWLKRNNIPALAGIDTRRLTRAIREKGMPNGVIVHAPDGNFDWSALKREAKEWPGLEGMDLAKDVSARQTWSLDETEWQWNKGYAKPDRPRFNVVVIDYGVKRNILRGLATVGAKITVVPADTSYEAIMRHAPDGVVLATPCR